MERRSESRIVLDEPVLVALLNSGEPNFSATVVNISGDGLCLAVSRPLQNGDPVKVICHDSLYLGEVVWYKAGRAGIRLEQALHGIKRWRDLNQQMFTP